MCWYKPFLKPFVSRFIAGETLNEAISYGKRLQKKGIFPIYDLLGEGASRKEETVRIGDRYIRLLDEMQRNHIHGAIALKLTAFALDADEETCFRSVSRVVRHAHALKIIVWIDMEGSGYTTHTLKMYRRLLSDFDNVGICIQLYLKRAKRDILSLLPDEPKIRLVKGVYPQKSELTYHTHAQINENFKQLITLMSEKNAWTAIGTHDMNIISHALTLAFPTHMEFQLLKGVRDDEKQLLAEHHYNIGEYVPFGEKWEKYVLRRFTERMRNIKWIILSLIGLDKK